MLYEKSIAVTVPQLVAQYGTLEKAQLQMAVDEADAIIKHFITQSQIAVTVTVETTGTAIAQAGGGTGIGKIT